MAVCLRDPWWQVISHGALSMPLAASCLITVAHQSPAAVLGTQEPVHQHCPSKGEVELDVLLKVSAQLVTVQVIAEGEALARDQHVYLISRRHRQKGLQAICQERKQRVCNQCRPVPHRGPTSGTESIQLLGLLQLCRNLTQVVSWWDWLTGHLPEPASSHTKVSACILSHMATQVHRE